MRPSRILGALGRGTGWKLRQRMTPGRTGDGELMVEQVERLGARRLAEIVVNHCHRDDGLHQTVRIALAASTPGGPLVKTLATEIDTVRASRHFYGYRESNVLAQELDRIRQAITEYLRPAQPSAAAELLGRLIRLDANVYGQTGTASSLGPMPVRRKRTLGELMDGVLLCGGEHLLGSFPHCDQGSRITKSIRSHRTPGPSLGRARR